MGGVQESVHLYTTDENVNLTTSEEGNLSSSIKKKTHTHGI